MTVQIMRAEIDRMEEGQSYVNGEMKPNCQPVESQQSNPTVNQLFYLLQQKCLMTN